MATAAAACIRRLGRVNFRLGIASSVFKRGGSARVHSYLTMGVEKRNDGKNATANSAAEASAPKRLLRRARERRAALPHSERRPLASASEWHNAAEVWFAEPDAEPGEDADGNRHAGIRRRRVGDDIGAHRSARAIRVYARFALKI